MSWLNRAKKGVKTQAPPEKRDLREGLWTKCPTCSDIIYRVELEKGAVPFGPIEQSEPLIQGALQDTADALSLGLPPGPEMTPLAAGDIIQSWATGMATPWGIAFDGQDLSRFESHQVVALGIIQVPEGRRIFPEMTVVENLRMGSFIPATRPDRERNRTIASEREEVEISTEGSQIRVFVIPTNEELVIAENSVRGRRARERSPGSCGRSLVSMVESSHHRELDPLARVEVTRRGRRVARSRRS